MQTTVDNFIKYYESPETRPVFETVDEMLKWAGLYNLTTRSLKDELIDTKLSPLLIEELITVRIRSFLHYLIQVVFITFSTLLIRAN